MQVFVSDKNRVDPNGQEFEQANLNLIRSVDRLIMANVTDRAGLFADLRGYGNPPPKTDLKLINLVRRGDTATAEMTYRTTISGTTDAGGELAGFETEVSGSEGSITFRRIDGSWYFGLDDDSVERFESFEAAR